MAKTIAYCIGTDSTRVKEAHRLGSRCATGRADTWRTFTSCTVNADGSGEVLVTRDGEVLHHFTFGPENEERPEGQRLEMARLVISERFQ